MSLTLTEWLDLPCKEEEIKGNQADGYYLGIETIKAKIAEMNSLFKVRVEYSNFSHSFFDRNDKLQFVSGSLELKIVFIQPGYPLYSHLIGAATFDVNEYCKDGENNTHFAATLKSLCIANALLEYPQFGALLNTGEKQNKIKNTLKKFTQAT